MRTLADAASVDDSAPALEAHSLSKRYRRGVWALRAIDVSFPPGAIIGLVGPNAAGKSTLIKTWVGFERPTSGFVRVDGFDPFRQRHEVIQRLAYISQRTPLYRQLTVGEHVEFARILRPGFDARLAFSRLDALDIPRRASVAEVSGGQAAQLALTIALATRAHTILLDEPLASLDPLARREFLSALRMAVRTEGLTALLSSHIVTDVEQVADRIVVLGVGRKLLDESVDAIVRNHAVARNGTALPPGASEVAAITDSSGQPIRVLRTNGSIDGLETPGVEDVVMAYLAAGRTDRPT